MNLTKLVRKYAKEKTKFYDIHGLEVDDTD